MSDPYKVLGLRKQFTLVELRDRYKKLAMQVHPDKGGSEELFNLVTEAYRHLYKVYQQREQDRTYMDLKQGFQQFNNDNNVYQTNLFREQMAQQLKGGSSSSSQQNDAFNRMYEKYRLDDTYDHGYGHMMSQTTTAREDIDIPKTMKSFNLDGFNQRFDNQSVPKKSKHVVRYKEPEPLPLAQKISYTELGIDKVGDYSGKNDSSRNLQYMDYMVAHTTTKLIDPATVKKRPDFKSVDDYEAYRTQNTQMTDKELERYYRRQKKEQLREKKRQETLQQQDQRSFQHFEQISKGMLENEALAKLRRHY
jgi:curved DNA-binding protein CbpA